MQIETKFKSILLGNSFGFIVSIATQILLIPVMIKHWGPDLYGKWLIYYTVPNFISFYGSSLLSVGANQAVLRARQSDAKRITETKEIITKTAILAIGAGGITSLLILTTTAIFKHTLSAYNLSTVTLLPFLASSILSIASYTLEAPYRCKNIFPRCLLIFNSQRLLESIAIMIACMATKSIITVGLIIAIQKFAFLLFLHHDTKNHCSEFTPETESLQPNTFPYKNLIKGSIHSLAYTLANLIRQSITLPILAILINPRALAEFNAARTITRLPGFGMLVINNSTKTELTSHYNSAGFPTFKAIYKRALLATIAISALSIAAFYAVGNRAVEIWLGTSSLVGLPILMIAALQTCVEGILNAIKLFSFH